MSPKSTFCAKPPPGEGTKDLPLSALCANHLRSAHAVREAALASQDDLDLQCPRGHRPLEGFHPLCDGIFGIE
jgi:hypothetical protein